MEVQLDETAELAEATKMQESIKEF